jgi:hypothetical protein
MNGFANDAKVLSKRSRKFLKRTPSWKIIKAR